MGASYFRTSGPYDQYGLSARGVAIDTAMPKPEQFPRFKHYWLEGPRRPDGPLTIYGAARGTEHHRCISHGGQARNATPKESLASSWTSRRGSIRAEYRSSRNSAILEHVLVRRGEPQASGGLASGDSRQRRARDSDRQGERIWRPSTIRRASISAFVDRDSRVSDCYSAIAISTTTSTTAFSTSVGRPFGSSRSIFGAKAQCSLVEIQMVDETFDNIVAYWAPKAKCKSGHRRTCRYRLSWLDDIPFPEAVARTIGTWTGLGGRPGASHERPAGMRKFVIDSPGKVFDGLAGTTASS